MLIMMILLVLISKNTTNNLVIPVTDANVHLGLTGFNLKSSLQQ
jgi:hypothetical protein